jgi:hypothetical protein
MNFAVDYKNVNYVQSAIAGSSAMCIYCISMDKYFWIILASKSSEGPR